jgi:hypothetical protein
LERTNLEIVSLERLLPIVGKKDVIPLFQALEDAGLVEVRIAS